MKQLWMNYRNLIKKVKIRKVYLLLNQFLIVKEIIKIKVLNQKINNLYLIKEEANMRKVNNR